jgi:hypothetical protein
LRSGRQTHGTRGRTRAGPMRRRPLGGNGREW